MINESYLKDYFHITFLLCNIILKVRSLSLKYFENWGFNNIIIFLTCVERGLIETAYSLFEKPG